MLKTEKCHLSRLLMLVIGLIAMGCGARIASATFNTKTPTLTPTLKSETTLVPILNDCDGDACGHLTLTWDDTKQQYKAQNNSTDQWVRVDAANLAATATTCVAAGQAQYLSLKSITGAYQAKFDATCGNPAE